MSARGRLGWWVILMGLGAAAAGAAPPWTAPLKQQALARGYQATLPPHLSQLLGLSPKGESVAVRQLLGRAEQKVHTFNVTVDKPHDVVVFLVDERAQKTVAYLLTASGKLGKAVAYQIGGEPHELPVDQARPGLMREVRYWSEHASEGAPPPPNPAAPPAGAPPAH